LFIPVAIAIVVSQVLVNPAPRAWDSTPILRPQTTQGTWDYTVSKSDAIGVGRILNTRLLSPEPPPGTGIGVLFREAHELTFLPDEWLKGPLPLITQTVLCSRDRLQTRDYDTTLDQPIDDTVLIFLRRSGTEWYLFEGRYGYQGGVFRIEPSEVEAIGIDVAEAEKGSSLDSLVARSDLVVVGTPVVGRTEPCRAAGRNANCSLLEIEERLAGVATEQRIAAYGLHGALPTGRSLYFLRRTEEDVYETVPFYAGVMPIRGHGVDALDMSLSEAGFEIRRIDRVLNTPEPIPPFTP
jgi:hypothetical protein